MTCRSPDNQCRAMLIATSTLVAVVASAAASEPAPGSLRAKAATFSPRTRGGRKRRFWASLPKLAMVCMARETWTP